MVNSLHEKTFLVAVKVELTDLERALGLLADADPNSFFSLVDWASLSARRRRLYWVAMRTTLASVKRPMTAATVHLSGGKGEEERNSDGSVRGKIRQPQTRQTRTRSSRGDESASTCRQGRVQQRDKSVRLEGGWLRHRDRLGRRRTFAAPWPPLQPLRRQHQQRWSCWQQQQQRRSLQ